MKKFELDNGKSYNFTNQYNFIITISKNEDGYYIQNGKTTLGPFAKIMYEYFKEYDNDQFIFGVNPNNATIYRFGLNGLEQTEYVDSEKEYREQLIRLNTDNIIAKYKEAGFPLYQKVAAYDISRKKEGLGTIVKKPYRFLIFTTPYNEFFLADPSKKMISPNKCKKFDSLAELIIEARKCGLDFQDLPVAPKAKLQNLFYAMTSRAFTNDEITKILNEIKTSIGIDEYRNMQDKITYKIDTHRSCSINEFIANINNYTVNPEHIENRQGDYYNQRILVFNTDKFLKDAYEQCLPFQTKFYHVKVWYGNKLIYNNTLPESEEAKSALEKENTGEYFNWRSYRALETHNPEIEEQVRQSILHKLKLTRFKLKQPEELTN